MFSYKIQLDSLYNKKIKKTLPCFGNGLFMSSLVMKMPPFGSEFEKASRRNFTATWNLLLKTIIFQNEIRRALVIW